MVCFFGVLFYDISTTYFQPVASSVRSVINVSPCYAPVGVTSDSLPALRPPPRRQRTFGGAFWSGQGDRGDAARHPREKMTRLLRRRHPRLVRARRDNLPVDPGRGSGDGQVAAVAVRADRSGPSLNVTRPGPHAPASPTTRSAKWDELLPWRWNGLRPRRTVMKSQSEPCSHSGRVECFFAPNWESFTLLVQSNST
jgi:hypothetical protein